MSKSIKEDRSADGILECVFEHAISETKVRFKYKGPMIEWNDWHQVLSFFQWTYDTTKSESQVRIYLDPVDKKIRFWAFPQEAKTGMSAREVDNDDKKKQRSELPNAGRLIPIGTAHHHCSSTAFQSGTDYQDEKDVDGLHITVGKMDEERYDIHYRFYRAGWEIPTNLSMFWNIGDAVAEAVPPDQWGNVAKYQMTCKKAVPFPEQWKKNLIEIKPAEHKHVTTTYQGGLGYSGNSGAYESFWARKDSAAIETLIDWLAMKMDMADMVALAKFLANSPAVLKLKVNANIGSVQIDDVARELLDVFDKPDYMVRRLASRGVHIDNVVKLSKKEKKQKLLELKDKINTGSAGGNGGNGGAAEKKETGSPSTSSGVTGRRWWNAAKQIWMDECGNPLDAEEETGKYWSGMME